LLNPLDRDPDARGDAGALARAKAGLPAIGMRAVAIEGDGVTTVWKRGDKWVGKVSVHGRQVWLGTFETRKEARAAEHEALANARLTTATSKTCRAFADQWLRDYARPAASTQRTYRYAIRRFVDEFGQTRLDHVDRLGALAWARRNPRSTVKAARAMFADALDAGLIQTNPLANLRLEQPRGRKDLDALTEAEVLALADEALAVHASFGPMMRALILFLGFVGARPGEAFALRRDDIKGDEVTIRRSVDAAGQLKMPKNGKPRTVVLPPVVREALDRIPPRIATSSPIPSGNPSAPRSASRSPWVFTTKRGNRFSKASLSYYFNPVRAAAGRPRLQPYELRHACATMLMERGVDPADVAQQLGHSDHGRLVQELYGHPRDRRARERIRRAFGGNVHELKSVEDGEVADGPR
jgi:integrase